MVYQWICVIYQTLSAPVQIKYNSLNGDFNIQISAFDKAIFYSPEIYENILNIFRSEIKTIKIAV